MFVLLSIPFAFAFLTLILTLVLSDESTALVNEYKSSREINFFPRTIKELIMTQVATSNAEQ